MTPTLPYPLRTIHVDDEPLSLQRLKSTIENRADIEYLGGFLSADEALEYLGKEDVDLVFCDVEMPGHDGLWLAGQIAEKNIQIVFLTNHVGYAMHAFEACALDYILKPITDDKLSIMLDRVKHSLIGNPSPKAEQIEEFYNYSNPGAIPSKIFITTLNEIIIVNLEDVVYFSSKSNYSIIILKNGEKQTISKTIKTFEEALKNNKRFLRVSRFYIVNKECIKLIKRNKVRHFALTMDNGDVLDTSYRTKEELLANL